MCDLSEFYKAYDNRLTNFIHALTAKKVNDNNECLNYKYNAYENILKALNSKSPWFGCSKTQDLLTST